MMNLSVLGFELYVDDARYSVPTLYLITAADEASARQIAENTLGDSPHHLGVELCQDGEVLLVLGSYATRPRWAPDSPAAASAESL